MTGQKRLALRKQDRPFKHVPELAEVARPGIVRKHAEHFRSERQVRIAEAGEDVFAEPRYVLGPLPEWREDDREHAYPVIEVFPETAGFGFLEQIAVCGAQEPKIAPADLVFADSSE